MNKLLILTTDGQEKIVYKIEKFELTNLFYSFFMELCSFVDIKIPEFNPIYKIINSSIKTLKAKNNNHIKSSLKLSVNNFTYECILQKPQNLQKKIWHVMCEDLIQLKINNIESETKFFIYAINNNSDNKDLQSDYSFFVNNDTLVNLDFIIKEINQFLYEKKIRHAYTHIYKKIIQKQNFREFKEAINMSPLKNELLNNNLFIFTCIYNNINPYDFLQNLLLTEFIKPQWENGKDFINFFNTYFEKTPENIKCSLLSAYDKYIFYKKLNNLKNNTKLNHTKLIKI